MGNCFTSSGDEERVVQIKAQLPTLKEQGNSANPTPKEAKPDDARHSPDAIRAFS